MKYADSNPIIPFLKLLLGIIFLITAILWLIQMYIPSYSEYSETSLKTMLEIVLSFHGLMSSSSILRNKMQGSSAHLFSLTSASICYGAFRKAISSLGSGYLSAADSTRWNKIKLGWTASSSMSFSFRSLQWAWFSYASAVSPPTPETQKFIWFSGSKLTTCTSTTPSIRTMSSTSPSLPGLWWLCSTC